MSFVGIAWDWYARNRDVLTAVGALTGGGLLTWGALQQPAFAALRLKERHETNRHPGTTEVFGKAVDQLGSVKAHVCLGGIYTLERISRDSKHDHYAVMEVLTAFIRERARWNGQDSVPSPAATTGHTATADPKSAREEPRKDIAAALAVIIRRENAAQGLTGSRIDLRGTNLGGVDLAHAPLRKANLSGTNLSSANLASADLSGANLSRSNLHAASFVGASMGRVNLSGACLILADFRGADLHEADISWADLKDACLYGATLCGATVVEVRLVGACLHGADLSRANFSGSDLSEAQLGGANLSNTNLKQANLGRSMLRRANLSGASLYEAGLQGADLRAANLTGADLSWADLSDALLSWADLKGAVLYGANLSGADLSGADLRGADLRGIDLSTANLRDAVLHGAVLRMTSEPGADGVDPGDAEVDEVALTEVTAMACANDRDATIVRDLLSGDINLLSTAEPDQLRSDLLALAGPIRPAWSALPQALADYPPARAAGSS